MLAWTQMAQSEEDAPNGVRFGVSVPDVPGELDHLPVMLGELGTCREDMNGPVALDFHEIDSWARRLWPDLAPFEFRALRRMSAAFVGIARQKSPPCPTGDVEVQESVSLTNAPSWKALARPSSG